MSSDLADTSSSNNYVLKRYGGALWQLLIALAALGGLRAMRRQW